MFSTSIIAFIGYKHAYNDWYGNLQEGEAILQATQ